MGGYSPPELRLCNMVADKLMVIKSAPYHEQAFNKPSDTTLASQHRGETCFLFPDIDTASDFLADYLYHYDTDFNSYSVGDQVLVVWSGRELTRSELLTTIKTLSRSVDSLRAELKSLT